MPIQACKLSCICVAMVTLAAAGDPWNQKKSSEWTDADAQLVITRSPWAIPTKLQCGNPLASCKGPFHPPDAAPQPHVADARPIEPSPLPTSGTLDPGPVMIPGASVCVGSEQVCHPPDYDKRVAEIQKRLGVQPSSVTMAVPPSLRDTVIVLWESAAPVRTAKAKLGVIDTTNQRATSSYVVSVIGYPMQTAIGHDLDLKRPLPAQIRSIVQQSGSLILKGRHPIEASDIEIEGTENAMNVRFFFPNDGAISTNEKSVQFRMQVLLGDIVEANFLPKTMVYEGKSAVADYPNVATRP
jgi:hypothetical protein